MFFFCCVLSVWQVWFLGSFAGKPARLPAPGELALTPSSRAVGQPGSWKLGRFWHPGMGMYIQCTIGMFYICVQWTFKPIHVHFV